jgi:DNA invertase Pin-like site-specific DNA recombinase
MERLDVPLKNMMYDHIAYDTSNKIKKSLRISKESGNFVGSFVIYGYKKYSNDTHKLVIDNEAADVVRKIFHMYLFGMTKSEIADELNKSETLTPALYKKNNGLGYTKPKKDNKWNYEIIDRILKDENYTGVLVQGKRRNESLYYS